MKIRPGYYCFFFFQAEDGIRDRNVTGVQTCALPILTTSSSRWAAAVAAVALFWSPKPACAQTATPAAGAQQAAAAAPPLAGFDDGFFIQTANGDTRLVFGMVAQTDGRFSFDDLPQIT